MCLMAVNKSLHPPLLCKPTGVNEFIALLGPKCTFCQVFLTVCDSAGFPCYLIWEKLVRFQFPYIFTPIE